MQRRTLLKCSLAAAAAYGGWPLFAQSVAHRSRLVMLGTQGGPNYSVERGETAHALVVDGALYLIDCGYGALAALVRAGLSYRSVDHIFLTHLHDDHSADLPSIIGHQWTDGRVKPVGIYGPAGTARLVAAAVDYNATNEEIRLVDEARSVRVRDLYSGHDVLAGAKATAVFADDRVRVTAVENTHYPEESKRRMTHRSISLRFDTSDRSIAFSGDTAVSSAVVELAKGADVLVCEAIDVQLMRAAFDIRVAAGAYADNPEGIWRHIVTTHTTSEQAGQMAAEAGVKTLVLGHLVPGALSRAPDEVYAAAARKHFGGEIVVGRDLLEI